MWRSIKLIMQGDVAKAFGAGADFVMLGGMLAGHDESGGKLVERDGRQFKQFYGCVLNLSSMWSVRPLKLIG